MGTGLSLTWEYEGEALSFAEEAERDGTTGSDQPESLLTREVQLSVEIPGVETGEEESHYIDCRHWS